MMKCKYCNSEITDGGLCDRCKQLRHNYAATKSSSHHTLYNKVRMARAEYALLMLPNPPLSLINIRNDGMWPVSLQYVNCDICGRSDLIGRCNVYKNNIICSRCMDEKHIKVYR